MIPTDELQWEFWIDRGGTFTDIVARQPDGNLTHCKLLSVNPDHYADAAIAGIRKLMAVAESAPLDVARIKAVKMGTTVATNALLERQGEKTLLLITRGFADALQIAYQNRPDLFALDIQLPQMLYQSVVEINERIDAQGKVLTSLDAQHARHALTRAHAAGINSVAIVLMHGYRYPQHEQQLAQIARSAGFDQISTSHQTSPLIKLVARGDTTVVDAYLTPILKRYIEQVSSALDGLEQQGGQLKFMQSSGGLTDAALFQGKDAILSGPAGGMVGMVRTAQQAGFNRLIGFDMGGTSTDVSHFCGTRQDKFDETSVDYERTTQSQIAGVRLRVPMMQIHTVAAGGGSILNFDGARFRVGPESAGAYPGPCGYRNLGPLTVTDCNIMLGKIQPELFPAVFGPDANLPLDKQRVHNTFDSLAQQINQASGKSMRAEQVADGFIRIAVENMANAIKTISVQRGYDVSDYVLCCFGGAGGQHACQVAESLGINRVFIHPYAGVLSAFGMGLADTIASRQAAVERELDDALIQTLETTAETLLRACRDELQRQDIDIGKTTENRLLHLRYGGSDTTLPCRYDTLKKMRNTFESMHQQQFGFKDPDKPLIVESMQVDLLAPGHQPQLPKVKAEKPFAKAVTNCPLYTRGEWRDCPFYQREALALGQIIHGPAVLLESTGTTVVESGWSAQLTQDANLILTKSGKQTAAEPVSGSGEHESGSPDNDSGPDPVMLEIFNNLFMSIAEQMGFVLANTAVSVNIKERLDFSCAIFSKSGELVANAPHMPVHLGSMGESIKAVIRDCRDLAPGDAIVMNAPFNGGTHLPDVTVVKPVFRISDKASPELIFFVASRGHHADIGGKTPGSAPADSTRIDEEGILINPQILVKKGRFQEASIRRLLGSGPYPARNIDTNIADFKAQLAACEKGAAELDRLIAHYGLSTVHSYMQYVQDNAEESVRKVLATLQDGSFSYEMDNGLKICVSIHVDKTNRQARIDFSGSSAQHEGNYNAPLAITRAAVLYVFRCLVNDRIPLNEGCLKPLELIVPEGSVINPRYPAAVIAGNVETSQYVVDCLFGALKVMAASQGTMNNLFFGNASHQYYETLCGGAGATPTANGADAVHTHMTNSRLTDPEVLEHRFPVILESFAIRQGSGGAGKHTGGNGVTRQLRFLEPMTATLLTGHRRIPPYGMAGGQPGKVGRNRVKRANGKIEELATTAEVTLEAGDTLIIETPGGGGYGTLPNRVKTD